MLKPSHKLSYSYLFVSGWLLIKDNMYLFVTTRIKSGRTSYIFLWSCEHGIMYAMSRNVMTQFRKPYRIRNLSPFRGSQLFNSIGQRCCHRLKMPCHFFHVFVMFRAPYTSTLIHYPPKNVFQVIAKSTLALAL